MPRRSETEQPAARHHPPSMFVVLAIFWAGLWGLTLIAASQITVNDTLKTIALFVHLLSLVVALGAVLTVDYLGLLWALKRRPLSAVLKAGRDGQGLIWLGLFGLLASGLFLDPPLDTWRTRVKMGAVLILGLNGLFAWYLEGSISRRFWSLKHLLFHHRHQEAMEYDLLPKKLMFMSMTGTVVSQLGWWVAVVLGFATSQS